MEQVQLSIGSPTAALAPPLERFRRDSETFVSPCRMHGETNPPQPPREAEEMARYGQIVGIRWI